MWSELSISCSFTWKYEGECFERSGLKKGMVSEQGSLLSVWSFFVSVCFAQAFWKMCSPVISVFPATFSSFCESGSHELQSH